MSDAQLLARWHAMSRWDEFWLFALDCELYMAMHSVAMDEMFAVYKLCLLDRNYRTEVRYE